MASLITCPHCGKRPKEEFSIRGDASVVRPAADAAGDMLRVLNGLPVEETGGFLRAAGTSCLGSRAGVKSALLSF